MRLLESIQSPADLKALSADQLGQLAHELRVFIIDSVSTTGGHLAANLGTVELTLALHRVLDLPRDVLVWDVGHQAYAHKILTGRREAMGSLRKLGGLSGFTKREESPFDPFGAGHSSTSISAALGFAKAFKMRGLPHQAVAVIGDGAMTAGQAFEALNHAGAGKTNLLVVLNDNAMSISPNVGALNKHLARLITSRTYNRMREGGKQLLDFLPGMVQLARRAEEHVKGMLTEGTLFEELGFRYVGPVDGHDLDTLIDVLGNLTEQTGPHLLHVVTQKGRGYAPAEADPVRFHGVSTFNPYKIEPTTPAKNAPTFTSVFGEWLCKVATHDDRVVGITPAMCEGSGMVDFSMRFPKRYHDVGIAEQHAVTFAGGLAAAGMKPVMAIYSTFLQRGFDQTVHDIALQNLPVLFAIDRAGLVGADGATHAGLYDIAFLRCVPNMLLMTPSDEAECHLMLTTGLNHSGPSAVRYPRGCGSGVPVPESLDTLPIGQAVWRRHRKGEHKGIAILAFGPLLHEAMKAAEAVDASVIDMRFVKPLDRDALRKAASTHAQLVTIEDHALMGGAGSAVLEALSEEGLVVPVLRLGLPDVITIQGSQAELHRHYGLDSEGILRKIRALLK